MSEILHRRRTMPQPKASPSRDKVEKLLALMPPGGSLLIVLQDNPDPDAIAAGAGLRALINARCSGSCSFVHGGTLGRAENRALVAYLGLNMRAWDEVNIEKFDLTALVDTQPATGNNSLPIEMIPDIVIDHHPIRNQTRSCRFTDIRSHYGAATTIVYEYLVQAEIPIETKLATALLYGIGSDTQDLGREAGAADTEAYTTLYRIANTRMLTRIRAAPVSRDYFRGLHRALANAQLYGKAIVSGLGDVTHPDMIGEAADLLLRSEGISYVLCYGLYEDELLLSLRSAGTVTDAGDIMASTVKGMGTGGGHDTLAGGQIRLSGRTPSEREDIRARLVDRFLKLISEAGTQATPLLAKP